jgi:hypothetical protein
MSKPLPALLGAFAAIAIVGCAASQGPEIDRPQLIAQSLPEADKAVQVSYVATWLPDTDGYGALLSSQPAFHGGTFVLAETATSFVQWNAGDKRYHILWRSPYAEIASCRMDVYGRGRRLVIQLRDFRTHSFEITGGMAIDREKTRQAFDLLGQHAGCKAR